jgi:hypothetical protein
VLLDSERFISVEEGRVWVAGRDTVDVDDLFGSGLALEGAVIEADDSFGLESIFNLVVVVLKPLIVKAFLDNLGLFPRLFLRGKAIGNIWRN